MKNINRAVRMVNVNPEIDFEVWGRGKGKIVKRPLLKAVSCYPKVDLNKSQWGKYFEHRGIVIIDRDERGYLVPVGKTVANFLTKNKLSISDVKEIIEIVTIDSEGPDTEAHYRTVVLYTDERPLSERVMSWLSYKIRSIKNGS